MPPLIQFPRNPDCTLCPKHKEAKTVCVPTVRVPSLEGDNTPAVVFLGLNPGDEEDQRGEPFLGKAGNILRTSYFAPPTPEDLPLPEIATIYLTNVGRCGPSPEIRPKDAKLCFETYATPDILEITRRHFPAVLIALGAVAAKTALGSPSLKKAFSQNGREVWELNKDNPRFLLGHYHFATYHPAYLLPHRSPGSITTVIDHMRVVHRLLRPHQSEPPNPEPTIVPPFYPRSSHADDPNTLHQPCAGGGQTPT